ncbi:protein-disulfide reductase DsbD domain-containing protein [Govanella unica]|uniref:Protein-disulfide reductase DsbD family protein n=1 Tax=Govanella unica TaxID=2975056 RepID=A0A9X3TXW2_9PROT|nr:protein-disulfide reductase DsbD domain-containing protein [Govania unica]MDA5193357.1 protein-disulfide reductase DsbD family protein [Govania unica]
MTLSMQALCSISALICCGVVSGALADDLPSRASLWELGTQADTRLVSAVTAVAPGRDQLELGWQVALKGKWKTYWRAPGDAGLPPDWDWAGSTNVADVSVGWPAPERMSVFGLDSYIYRNDVVLPLHVRLKNPGQAADLRLKVDYMVCEEICVPLEARYRLFVPAGTAQPTAEAALIRLYEARIPHQKGPVSISAAQYETHCGKPRLTLTLAAALPKKAAIDVYVDGPDGVTYGRPVVAADGRRLTLDVRGLKSVDPRKAEPIHLVLRPPAGQPIAWDGVPLASAQQTCVRAGS